MFALNQGEVCTCPSRGLIQNSILEQFLPAVTERTKAIKQGNPLDTETMIGAQASSEQKEKILSYFDIGRKEGAEVLIGGEAADHGGELSGGFYIKPTVFKGHNKMRIFQEEIFGPVVAITPFDTEEEALALANGVRYGLAAYVWTNDLKRAHNFSQSVEAGMVWLNSNNVRDLRTPFGGVKASGLGHEGGYRSIDFYTDQQAVHINLGEVHNPVFGKQGK